MKEQEYFNMISPPSHFYEKNNENNTKIYFKDLQSLKEEKEFFKNKFQNSGKI